MNSAYICGAVRTPFANVNSYFHSLSMASLAALPLRDMTRRNASLDWGSVDGLYIGSNNKKFSAVPELGKFVTEYLSGTAIKATVPAKSLNFSYCSGLAAVGQAYLDIAAGLRRFTVVGGVGSAAGVDSSLISGAGARSEAESGKKLNEQRKKMQTELREVDRLSFVSKEMQESIKESPQHQLQDVEKRRNDLMPEHQKVQMAPPKQTARERTRELGEHQ